LRITILTYGSRGDVQPFVALGLGLQKAGHTVKLAAPHRFSGFVEQFGISFAPLPGDPEEISLRLNESRKNVLRAIKSMRGYIYSIAGPVSQAAVAACIDADLIIHSFLFTTGGHSLARAQGIPDVSIQGFPMFAPTRAYPNVALPNLSPGVLSYFSHWLAAKIFWYGGNWGFKEWAVTKPDGIDFNLYWPFDPSNPRQTPLLFAYSPIVLPKPTDWTAKNIHITGYFTLETSDTYDPPADLVDYLASGDPPVCVTFGSMVNKDAENLFRIIREALKRTCRRGIILSGWSGIGTSDYDENLIYLESAPHDWLLPRCSSVLHHGGAGTTAAGLRAGIPNLVIPHAGDQWFWGKRIAAIGAGPSPIDLDSLSIESLASAINQSDDDRLRRQAEEIGRRIRAEDGVVEAVRLIELHANEADHKPVRFGSKVPGLDPVILEQ
jgi:sterol 3beta-glucosyltransferase